MRSHQQSRIPGGMPMLTTRFACASMAAASGLSGSVRGSPRSEVTRRRVACGRRASHGHGGSHPRAGSIACPPKPRAPRSFTNPIRKRNEAFSAVRFATAVVVVMQHTVVAGGRQRLVRMLKSGGRGALELLATARAARQRRSRFVRGTRSRGENMTTAQRPSRPPRLPLERQDRQRPAARIETASADANTPGRFAREASGIVRPSAAGPSERQT